MKKRNLTIFITIIMFISLSIIFIPGCGKGEKAEEQKVIRIGAIIPLTGWSSEFGQHEKTATEIAVKKLKKEYDKWQINLIIEDTQSTAKNAVNAYRKMMSTQKPQFVLVESSSASLALGNLFDKDKVIMLSISANPEVTKNFRFVFRNFPTAEEEARKILDFAIHTMNLKKVGIFYINNDYGLGYKIPFEKYTKDFKGELSFSDSYSSDTKDFKSLIEKFLNVKTDGVYIVGYGSAMGLIIKQIKELGYRGEVLACSSVIYDDVLSVAHEAIEGVIFSDIPYDIDKPSGETKEFVEKYLEKTGKSPSPLAAMTYDGIMMITKNLIESKGNSVKTIEMLLKKAEYNGINGTIKIPPSRDLKYKLCIKQVKGGKGKIIE